MTKPLYLSLWVSNPKKSTVTHFFIRTSTFCLRLNCSQFVKIKAYFMFLIQQ